MPRIDHVAVETDDPRGTATFYERILGGRIVEAEGHPVMAYLGDTGFAFHEPGGRITRRCASPRRTARS